MIFAVYREVKNPRHRSEYGWGFRPEPTRVETIEVAHIEAAVQHFLDTRKSVWSTGDAVINYLNRHTVAHVWLRRFTPTGRYKGETKFMIYEVEK